MDHCCCLCNKHTSVKFIIRLYKKDYIKRINVIIFYIIKYMVMGVKAQGCSLCHQIRLFVLVCVKTRLNVAMYEWNAAGLSALSFSAACFQTSVGHHLLYPTRQGLHLEPSFITAHLVFLYLSLVHRSWEGHLYNCGRVPQRRQWSHSEGRRVQGTGLLPAAHISQGNPRHLTPLFINGWISFYCNCI